VGQDAIHLWVPQAHRRQWSTERDRLAKDSTVLEKVLPCNATVRRPACHNPHLAKLATP